MDSKEFRSEEMISKGSFFQTASYNITRCLEFNIIIRVIISGCTRHTGFSRVVSGLLAVRPDAHRDKYKRNATISYRQYYSGPRRLT